LVHACAIDRSQPISRRWVVDQQEAPGLPIAAARRADRGVEDACLHVERDRIGFQPAHRARGVERFVNLQDSLQFGRSLRCHYPARHNKTAPGTGWNRSGAVVELTRCYAERGTSTWA